MCGNLHESLVLLLGALKKELPEFERTHRTEFEKTVVCYPWKQSQLEQIDALLEELANPRTE